MNIEAREIIGDATPALFEDVEQRTLMSVATLENHTLTINVDEGNDQINLELNDDASILTADVNGERQSFAANTIYTIKIDAGDGNNWVALDARIGANASIITGSGNDTVYGGMGHDNIQTGGGRDVIDARAGNDFIDAGSGNDKINGGSGNDVINAGSGNDSLSADGGKDKLMGRKGNDKFYSDNDDTVQTDGGKNTVYKTKDFANRNDGFSGPAVQSVSIVNADTGKVVSGYEKLTSNTILDASKLPTRYTIVANTDDNAKSVYFNILGDKSFSRTDSDGTFSATGDAGDAKFLAWTPTANGTYTLHAQANTAEGNKGIRGDLFSIKLTHKPAATGAGNETPTTPTKPTTPTNNNDPAAPKIKLNVLTTGTVSTGQGFHAEATGTTIPGYDVEDAKFEWNFGDASGKFNTLSGFNAGHVYDKAGTYTVTLTVTAPGGKVSKATTTVVVKAAAYTKTIYVAANGNDNREGDSQDAPVKTLARAAQLATDDTRILLRRGDTFGVVGTAMIENDNVEIATYGVGSAPVIRYEGARVLTSMITVSKSAENVAINGLTFTSIYDKDTEQSGMCHAIVNGGSNVTIRNNTFLHVGYAINNNGSPNGVYIGSNSAPLANGLRGYFSWTQGQNFTIVGNTVVNSTREHAIRASDASNVTIAYNDLANLDRRPSGDKSDYSKAAINIQRGSYAYISNNNVEDGPLSVGPLGGGDGVGAKSARFTHGVIEGNNLTNTHVEVQHGTDHATIRDNVITSNDRSQIVVHGWNVNYGRGVTDLVIDHNIGFNGGTAGRFLEIDAHIENTVLVNNVYYAPSLKPGGYGASAFYVADGNSSSFKTVNGNVWPTGKKGNADTGDLIILGGSYISADKWNAYGNVGTDLVKDVTESEAYKITDSLLKAA